MRGFCIFYGLTFLTASLFALDLTLLEKAENSSHPLQQKIALEQLYANSQKDPEARPILEPLLKALARAETPNQWSALEILWKWPFGSPSTLDVMRMDLTPEMLKIARNPHHPQQFLALKNLWYSGDAQQTANRKDIKEELQKMAVDPNNSHAVDASNMIDAS